jgi:hypothetical protein
MSDDFSKVDWSVFGPPARKPRIVLWTVVAIVVVLAIGAGAAAVLIFRSRPSAAEQTLMDQDRRVHLRLPDRIGSLVPSTTPRDTEQADVLLAELRKQNSSIEAVAGFYVDSTDSSKEALVLTWTGSFDDLDDALGQVSFAVATTRPVDPGPLGGKARCATGATQFGNTASCAWADYGTVGEVQLWSFEVSEMEPTFIEIRDAVTVRS